MGILKIVLTVLEALLALNLMIFVHELGHFLAARWRGMKVSRFAVWFGKPIWQTKINGIEYALGWIPAGGYVLLPQMATMEIIEGKADVSGETLPSAPPLDKIIVAFAGPLFTFLLAIAFALVVWVVGKPEQRSKESTTIGWVAPDGPAAKAGLQAGDNILEVDGHPVSQFYPPSPDSVTWRIITSEGPNIPIKYERDGKEGMASPVPTKLPTKWYERKSLRKIIIVPAQPAILGEVISNSPAALAGLQVGDEVVGMDGKQIYSPEAVIYAEQLLTNGEIKPINFSVRRGNREFTRALLAERPLKPPHANPSFGILAWLLNTNEVITYPTPMDQIRDSAGQIIATLGTVLSRKSDVGFQQLGGPVMIIRAYQNFLESENGWRRVLWFSVVLNVNLALLNLLPFPVLDGGHIALALLEVVRRRPVSARLLNFLQSACAVILIAFMLFIAFFDVGDWARSAKDERQEPVVFAPKH